MALSLRGLCLLSVLAAQVLAVPYRDTNGKRVICYFGSWAVYRYGEARFTSADVDPKLCDYTIYTFVGCDPTTGKLRVLDSWMDEGDEWKKGLIPEIVEKTHASKSKVMVAIGGWNEGSATYSKVTCNDGLRKNLIDSIVAFVDKHNLDGFDIDWEYPAQRDGGPNDRQCFSKFLQELYPLLKAKGKVLSAAVTANALTIPVSYDVPTVAQNLDFINVMAYDLHGSWESRTGHHAALYPRAGEPAGESHLNIESAVDSWLSNGCPPEKLNLGIGTYGRSFTLLDPSQNGIGAPAGGIPPCGWIQENGFYAYKEICTNNQTVWTTKWDSEQQVPYAFNGRNWVGYDDEASVRAKTCFAKSKNLGGMMVWSIETDDFSGKCGKGKYPLINSIVSSLADPSCGSGSAPVVPDTPQTEEPETETPAPETEASVPETEAPVPETEAPATETEAPAPETEAPAPETEAPAPETEAPAPQEPGSGSTEVLPKTQCITVGDRIRDPNDCSTFWYCTYAPDGSLTATKMNCATGLGYDPNLGICNYRTTLKC